MGRKAKITIRYNGHEVLYYVVQTRPYTVFNPNIMTTPIVDEGHFFIIRTDGGVIPVRAGESFTDAYKRKASYRFLEMFEFELSGDIPYAAKRASVRFVMETFSRGKENMLCRNGVAECDRFTLRIAGRGKLSEREFPLVAVVAVTTETRGVTDTDGYIRYLLGI